ncbi:hypothetical protein M433DRAFT_168186 [Acidomyces richmondensis BFW]|nr:MAG: hypothetical protein FE78DRAFT_102018 [Acidomyces sp. 'richmondensis']KYG43098.1 hypothetical protein M433DRAFT_168186 [Acidomyces richmondensis BFW]
MFRTQANPMDDAVIKATDENLTSENWGLILDVCDRVSAAPSGPSQAVSSLIKRLAHRNANVQLYTLELANALSQNCGTNLHRELASKAFTDALLRLASDRTTHAQVKQKVLERMQGWTDEFKQDPDLGIMEQAYHKLRMQQPGLMPPSKPGKREIGVEDRRKEEEELQMALALSVQDKGGPNGQATGVAAGQTSGSDEATSGAGAQHQQQQQQQPAGTTAATVSRVRALYDFTPSEPGELAFRKNDIIAVLESVYKDWWKGSLRGQTGIFPLNYVEKLQDPTKEELERDAQMEAEVFGEIKNVEKLLALLSVRGEGGGGGRRGEREEEEIAELYQRTLSIRPKLIELIGKYSQKKDDFTSLNEKFIKARRDYENLLESSMSASQYTQKYPVHPQQSGYPPQHLSQYGGPQQPTLVYPPQGPPLTQTYSPPQQPYGARSQQHIPPAQQDPQRYYSPGPSEPPSSQLGPGYGSPYPPQNGPPSIQSANGGAAPFHFIPGGIQAPPPPSQQQQQQQPPPPSQPHPQQQQQQQQPQPQPQQQDLQIRRKPSPGQMPAQSQLNGSQLNEPYSAPSVPRPAAQGSQGQIRPNSIHTLNSGNPQELATSGYESPIDNRHSYAGPGLYDSYSAPQAPTFSPHHLQQQQQQPAPPQNDRDGLPSRQRTQSFESPSSLYSQQTAGNGGDVSAHAMYPAGPILPMGSQVSLPPPQPSGMPLGTPGVPQYQAYQAYQPGAINLQPGDGQGMPSGGSSGGGDPGDYYR